MGTWIAASEELLTYCIDSFKNVYVHESLCTQCFLQTKKFERKMLITENSVFLERVAWYKNY